MSKNTVSENSKLLILFTHIGGIFLSFLAPLIVMLASEDELVKKHSRSALNFQLTIIIGYIISSVLVIVLIGFLGYGVLYVANIVFSIIATVKSSENPNQVYNYPYSFQFLKDENNDNTPGSSTTEDVVDVKITENK
jgi:uncharacterized protein